MSDEPLKLSTKQLIVMAAQNLLAHHHAGRKCDPEGIRWAKWIVEHNQSAKPSNGGPQ